MSNFSSDLWFSWWLSQMRKRVSDRHRLNLHAVSIVHPTWGIRLLCTAGWAVFGSKFWNALHFAERVEELWLDGIMDEDTARQLIPQAVFSYESALIADAQEAREMAISAGAPLNREELSSQHLEPR